MAFYRLRRGLFMRLWAIIFAALGFAACDARLDGVIQRGGHGEFTLKSTPFPAAKRLLKSLSADGGAALDAKSLNSALALTPGVERAELSNTTDGGIIGRIDIADIGGFLNRKDSGNAAFWEQASSGGSFRLNLNLDSGAAFLSLISPDLVDYLSALMAPIATGEVISKQGYLELAASVYGKAVAAEIEKAEFLISLDFPGSISGIKGGTYKGGHADFVIPLLNLLVLEEALVYEVRWSS
jgi:hypothetical protein